MATILTKRSNTASSVPVAGDLTNSTGGAELAVNTADKRLFTKDSGGTVVELGTNPSSVTLPNGTANGVPYLNGSKVLTSGSALTFDGTNLATTGDILLNNARYYYGKTSGGTTVRLLGINSGNSLYVGIDSGPSDMLLNASSSSSNIQFLASGSEQMRLTSTGLGIGTSSPVSSLHVVGGIYTKSGTLPAPSASATNSFSVGNGTGVVQLASNGINAGEYGGFEFIGRKGDSSDPLTRMTINSSGNLGLGVTPSAWKSDYRAFTNGYGSFYGRTGGSVASGFSSNAYVDSAGTWTYTNSQFASRYQQELGTHLWFTAPSGTAGNAISFTQAMTLDASGNLVVGSTSTNGRINAYRSGNGNYFYMNDGTESWKLASTGTGLLQIGSGSVSNTMTFDRSGNVGIGTSSPSSSLHITSTTPIITLTDSDTGANSTISASSGEGSLFISADANNVSANTSMRFLTDGTERARIDSSGNFGIGTSSPSNRLHIFGGDNITRIQTSNTGASNVGMLLFYDGAGDFCGQITSNPSTNTTSYNTSSDYRLKDNIKDVTGSGEFIDNLRPRTWNWKSDGSVASGFIAHELQEVSPTSVVGEKDEVDSDGNPKYQSVEYGSSEVIAMLVAEVQELRKRIAALEAK